MKLSCRFCKKEVETSITLEQIIEYRTTRKHIQDIMPNVPPAERELLISGTCGKCWEEIFYETGGTIPGKLIEGALYQGEWLRILEVFSANCDLTKELDSALIKVLTKKACGVVELEE